MKFFQGPPPPPSPRYAEIAAMCRALGFNVKGDDFEHIDDVVLSRRGLEMLVRDAETR